MVQRERINSPKEEKQMSPSDNVGNEQTKQGKPHPVTQTITTCIGGVVSLKILLAPKLKSQLI